MILQQFIQGLRFFLVAPVIVERFGHRLDRPAVAAVVAFVPPAVGHRQVEHAVQTGLHARGAARFERVDRIVEPDIHARYQPAREPQIIVLDQQDAAFECRPARHLVDAPDQILPGHVGRVGLAGEQEQYRPLVVADQSLEPVDVLEQQRRPLVGGEPAGETDREHVRIGRIGEGEQAIEVGFRPVVAEVLFRHAVANQPQHRRLERLAHAPEQMVGDLVEPVPVTAVCDVVGPLESEEFVELVAPFLREERGDVDPVCV